MQGYEEHQDLFDAMIDLTLKLRGNQGLDENLYETLLSTTLERLEARKDDPVIDKGLAFIALVTPEAMWSTGGIYAEKGRAENAWEYQRLKAAVARFRTEAEAYFNGFEDPPGVE